MTLAYGARKVLDGLSLTIPPAPSPPSSAPTAAASPRCCACWAARSPSQGRALLDGADLAGLRPKAVARRLAYLPQDPQAPELITVRDAVARAAIRINRCCDYGARPTRKPSTPRWPIPS